MHEIGNIYTFTRVGSNNCQKDEYVYLSRVVEALPDDAIDDDPGKEQEAEEVSLDLSYILNTWTYVENFVAAEKIELLMPLRELIMVYLSTLQ